MKALYTFLFIFILNINLLFAQAPQLMGFFPQRQIINAPRNTQIIVTFSRPMSISTINDSTFKVFGRLSGPIQGTFNFQAANKQIVFTPNIPFLAGEWVTVSLSKRIKGDNNVPITNGFNWNFWTKAEPGTLNVTLVQTIPVRRQGEGLIQCYGALGVDFNNDNRPDLAVVNEVSVDFRLFLNNGTGYDTMYAIHPIPSGNYPSPSDAADFNHDWKVDIVIGNAGNSVLSKFIGTGNANFQAGVPYTGNMLVRGVAVVDFDGDSYDDVVTANRGGNDISLFRNTGTGNFAPAVNINTVGTQETAVMITDANNDGIQDAFVGCYTSNEIVLMLGNGNGSFVFSSRSGLTGRPWAINVGDINGDGKADVCAALSNINRVGVIFGDGMGGLGTVTTYNSGAFPLAMDIGDVDGDNDLDLISSNFSGGNYSVFRNNGSGVFTNTPITLPASDAGSCITVLDVDNDGDMDLAGIDEVDDLLFIFKNNPVGINQISNEVPLEFSLKQNYPNPFNPATKINFSIPNTLREESFGQYSILKIYDALGREITQLVNKNLEAGTYEVEFDASGYPSGIYFYKLTTGSFNETKRMLLIK